VDICSDVKGAALEVSGLGLDLIFTVCAPILLFLLSYHCCDRLWWLWWLVVAVQCESPWNLMKGVSVPCPIVSVQRPTFVCQPSPSPPPPLI
jgi:hypothetical protein